MSAHAGPSPALLSREYTFRCSLRNGLHARPATRFVEIATQFSSDISLTNQRTQAVADAKSLLSIVAIDLAESDECHVQILGADAEAALGAVREFTRDVLPACDEPLPTPAPDAQVVVPRVLRDTNITLCTGTRVCRGVARGAVVVLDRFAIPTDLAAEACGSSEEELRRVEEAIATVRGQLEARREAATCEAERGVLGAHLSIVTDRSLRQKITELVCSGCSAGGAVSQASRYFTDLFRDSDSPVTRERAIDVQDIAVQLLRQLYGAGVCEADPQLAEPSVVVAESLTPSQFQSLDLRFLQGLVLERAGVTSHAMILAAARGIPTLTDVDDACGRLARTESVIVDANCGLAFPALRGPAEAHYLRARRREDDRHRRLTQYVGQGIRTTDDQRFTVSANISTGPEVAAVFVQGADGIGLFRTELLYMDRDKPPSEEEQFAIFADAARAARKRPITIRTFDIGGDKPVPYLNLGRESNPFLGNRGVRLYREHTDLIDAQLRAILRASAFGRIKLMLPMISNVEEVRWVKARLARIREALQATGQAFDPHLSIGIMVEVPSVVCALRELSREVDFFSIGTNDLAQYFFAADRGNERVSALCDTNHPAFLRMLKQIIDDAHRYDRPVSMCGEMARSVRNLPLLVGLGLDEISVASSAVLQLKATVSELSAEECRRVVSAALEAADRDEIETIVQTYRAKRPAIRMSEPDLILAESNAVSKAAAIAEFVDALYVAGRTDAPDIVEAAFWAREDTCSTSVGHGFAIPHCKTDALSSNSFGVVRLANPIAWDGDGELQVRCIVALAIRESDPDRTHMSVLASLARKLMEDRFRSRLMAAGDRNELLSCLIEELNLKS